VQRAGRAARAPGRQGLAVMIVEKSAFEFVSVSVDDGNMDKRTSAIPEQQQFETVSLRGRGGRGHGGTRGGRGGGGVRRGTAYGVLHGSKRGQYGGTHDDVVEMLEDSLGPLESAPKEGLYLYIQTVNCRRVLLAKIFKNEASGK